MSKKKTKAQIIEGNTRQRYDRKSKIPREQLSDLCRNYLEKKELFRWFIEKYFGPQKYLELWELAEQDKEGDLRTELESIWFDLPDSIFNIQVCPSGWNSFIALIEE